MRKLALIIAVLMACATASANIRLGIGGRITLGEGGRIGIKGINPVPPAVPELLTPVMTANNAPSPNTVEFAGMEFSTTAYLAFDQNFSTNANNGVMPLAGAGDLRFNFSSGTTHLVTSLGIEFESGYAFSSFTLSGSNNNSTFYTLYTDTMADNDSLQEFAIATTTEYSCYKIAYTNTYRPDKKVRIEEIELRGIP